MPDLLTPKQLAEYLQLSQRTLYRMLERGQIPAVKVGGQWRFRKTAIDYWLDLRMHQLDSSQLQEIEAVAAGQGPLLWRVLSSANALVTVPSGTREDVVRAFVSGVTFPEPVDLGLLVSRILEREALCSTAVPEGVALLHTARWESRVMVSHDMLAVGRLSEPIDFGALDGSLTHTLFLVLARDERIHLRMLARAARLCREPSLVDRLREASSPTQVLDLFQAAESRVFGRRPS